MVELEPGASVVDIIGLALTHACQYNVIRLAAAMSHALEECLASDRGVAAREVALPHVNGINERCGNPPWFVRRRVAYSAGSRAGLEPWA
jgi:hypothetical protein